MKKISPRLCSALLVLSTIAISAGVCAPQETKPPEVGKQDEPSLEETMQWPKGKIEQEGGFWVTTQK